MLRRSTPSSPSRPQDYDAPLPTVSPRLFSRLAAATLVFSLLIIATGAAVRLTGSGLGCADWPTCSHGHLTPPLQFHSLVEWTNRVVSALFGFLLALTVLAALRRRPYRRDLLAISLLILGGVVVEIVLGGIVVYTTLNPYLVMLHFVGALPLILAALSLFARSSRDPDAAKRTLIVPSTFALIVRLTGVLLLVVLLAGSATTGAGPHSGSTTKIVGRIPADLRSLTELHSSLALLLVGLLLGLTLTLHLSGGIPGRTLRAARLLVATALAQAAVGYTQYFTHLPAAIVEVHEIGASLLVLAYAHLLITLTHRPPEDLTRPGSFPNERSAPIV